MDDHSGRLTKRAFLTHVRIAARRAVEYALSNAPDRFAAGTSAELQRIGERLGDLDQQVDRLREHTAKRQDEVDRLREGYDWSILRRFALRLIHTVDGLAARVTEHGPESEVGRRLEEVRLELTFLLESNDIVEWVPEVGQQVRDVLSRCEIIETRTSSPNDRGGQVLEVLRCGFILDPPNGTPRVLRPAQIAIAKKIEGSAFK